jgi:serine/threonine-protein kinase RsbW
LKVLASLCQNQPILSAAEVVLNGDLSEVERLVATTERFCHENALGDDVAFDLNLALEELFVNAVKHGGCRGMKRAIEIHIAVSGEGVQIDYADRGAPFDPSLAPPPDLNIPLESRQEGGFGLHLVRQVMQTFEYRRDDGWNRITMRRPVNL